MKNSKSSHGTVIPPGFYTKESLAAFSNPEVEALLSKISADARPQRNQHSAEIKKDKVIGILIAPEKLKGIT